MANFKSNKKAPALPGVSVSLLECPVCMETMSPPILQCQSGHSLCSTCTGNLVSPALCPICRMPMTQMRNWQLEDIVLKAKVPCPNETAGCKYTVVSADVDNHLKECLFRDMDCPLGTVFGKCSWRGKVDGIMDHFKDRHANHCNVNIDQDVVIDNVNIGHDDRHLFLVSQGKLLFIITLKIDTLQGMAYWTVQHIGTKKSASQHIYEIHVTNNQDSRRKVVFIDNCFNDVMKADEIFRLGKCAMLPLDGLKHFIKNKTLTFRFFIKRLTPGTATQKGKKDNKGNKDDRDVNKQENKGPNVRKGFNRRQQKQD